MMQSMTHPHGQGSDRGRQCAAPAAACGTTNVGDAERWVSVVGGAVLAGLGLACPDRLVKLTMPILGGMLVYRGLTGHCMMYQALGVSTAEKHGPATAVEAGHGAKVEASVIVDRPPQELYRAWRDFSRLPEIMSHLEEVRDLGGGRWRWTAKVAMGAGVSWDAELINDRPGEAIAWRSLPGSTVATAGSVHFVPAGAGRGTEVRVVLKYAPPMGKVGAALASWLGADPRRQIHEDLQRFKGRMEAQASPAMPQYAGSTSF